MIVLALLALQSLSAPTLEIVTRLPPDAAGDLILRGNQHARIVAIDEVVTTLQPPGITNLYLVEEALASEAGCSRKLWNATFRSEESADPSAATLMSAHSWYEIRLANSAFCPSNNYVRLNPRIDREAGFAALTILENIRAGAVKPKFSCADTTTSNLCRDFDAIRHELTMLSPWAVTRIDGNLELWLGTPGQVVTAVRFDLKEPGNVKIERRVPAPF